MAPAENGIKLRNSGFRIAFVGLFSLIMGFIIYYRLTIPSGEQPVMITLYLKNLANAIFILTIASMISIGYGAFRVFKAEQQITYNTNSLMSYITAVFIDNKYWKVMIISAIGYGIFFGFLSQIFIYRGDISFTAIGISVPSINVITCCNVPGYVPLFAAYITNHFLILLIPINIILAVVISVLVGFNISLNLFAYKMMKVQGTRKLTFFESIGVTTGLFVGCPTCAGSLFSALFGFGSGGTAVALLAPFQTLFIIISIPALIISPFFIARLIRARTICKSY
ncbi:MAG TPA: hypothetical protein VFJ51_01410 [Nitrososphaeraceae archaeon]|nr:hypothetical protein [Nitrososphaeraceae archaeon]